MVVPETCWWNSKNIKVATYLSLGYEMSRGNYEKDTIILLKQHFFYSQPEMKALDWSVDELEINQ